MTEITEKIESVEKRSNGELREIPFESMEKYNKLFDESTEQTKRESGEKKLQQLDDKTESYRNIFGDESDNISARDFDSETRNDSGKGKLDIGELVDDYLQDIKNNSVYPDTIDDGAFGNSDVERISPEENSQRREEFDDTKGVLKKQWEEKNGVPWPKYNHDIYSANGKLIRRAGDDYDAHHIQPLGLGGENTVKNITPLSAEVHYDKQGIHAPGSAYDKLCKAVGG